MDERTSRLESEPRTAHGHKNTYLINYVVISPQFADVTMAQ